MTHSTHPARRALRLVEQAAAELATEVDLDTAVPTPTTQADFADVLLDLIREKAPSAAWTLPACRHGSDRRLEGHLFGSFDVGKIRGLASWQRIIGAGPVQVRPDGAHEHHVIEGSYRGAAVRVVTVVKTSGGEAA